MSNNYWDEDEDDLDTDTDVQMEPNAQMKSVSKNLLSNLRVYPRCSVSGQSKKS
jgi:hypothetical protein